MIYRNELSIKWEPTQPVLKKQKSNQKKRRETQVQMLQA